MRLIFLAACTLLTSTDALKTQMPTGQLSTQAIGRRAALGLLPAAALVPAVASAKYRPSLAEMKGYGSSPVVGNHQRSSNPEAGAHAIWLIAH